MSEPITEGEALRRALVPFPDAYIGEDSEGQLVIYTGLYPSGTVVTTERVYELAPDWRFGNGAKGDEEC